MLRLGAQLLIVALTVALGGCALYQADPLPEKTNLLPAVPLVTGPGADELARPLSMVQVAELAVKYNPDLVAWRRKADVASAQAYSAGLLPDPQFSASVDHPIEAGLVNAYAFGLAEDLQALLLLPSREAAAEAAAAQAKLDALWQEWQTILKAATLHAQKSFADAKVEALGVTADALTAQSQRSSRALAARNSTIDQAGADLSASLDAEGQRDAATRDAMNAEQNLKALLGVDPAASLNVEALGDAGLMTREEIAAALAQVTKSRPDLLALQAGYQSQEENVYKAILSQFPAITFGYTRQRDTGNVHTNGLTLTVNLPIFNGARGEIRVQTATREQLRAEYQARLDQTVADAWRIWQEARLLAAQIRNLEDKLPGFERMAATARRAYREGNLAAATYVLLQTALVARQGQLFDLKAALWADVIALRANIGLPPMQIAKAESQ